MRRGKEGERVHFLGPESRSCRVSRIQSACSGGTVADIKGANKAVEYAISTYDRGLLFDCGLLDWKTPGALMSLVVTDASHVNESEEMIINEMTSIEGRRNQGARMVFLTDGALWNRDKGSIHPILWASNLVRRVLLHYTGRGLHTSGRCGGR